MVALDRRYGDDRRLPRTTDSPPLRVLVVVIGVARGGVMNPHVRRPTMARTPSATPSVVSTRSTLATHGS